MTPLPSSDRVERLAAVRREIAAAAERSGRNPAEISLLAVTKTQPVAAVRELWEAGVALFGENRVQEAAEKIPQLPARSDRPIEWHLIGPLQSNKVRQAVDLFRTFHAIDRPKIAEALDREAGQRNLALRGFLEVNLGEEPSKHGFSPRNLAGQVRPLADLAHLRIVGLMAIPPQGELLEEARSWFRRLRELRDELAARPEWAGFPGWLSMGMSDDFPAAIEEGATHVRVGTRLFGPRSK